LNSLWYNLHYVFTSMGVLLTLQTMDKARLESLGQNYEEETLEWGMEFLKAASSTNTLAARYVTMLQRLRSREKNLDTLRGSMPENGGESSAIRNGNAPEILLTETDETAWLPRRQDNCEGMQFQPAIDSEFADFNYLLCGTGLPWDFISGECPNVECLH